MPKVAILEGMDLNDFNVIMKTFAEHPQDREFQTVEEFNTCLQAFILKNKAELVQKAQLARFRELKIKFPAGFSQRDRAIVLDGVNRQFMQNPPRTKLEDYEHGNAWLKTQGFDFEFNHPAETRFL